MTLIAIACNGDSAEFITDSMSYTHNLSRLANSTKSLLLHHLDAAVLTQGDGMFSTEAKSLLLGLSDLIESFDELVEKAPAALSDLWVSVASATTGRHLSPAIVFLVGYSTKSQKFEAYLCAAEAGFCPEPISGLHVMPSPWTCQPSRIEFERVVDEYRDNDTPQASAFWKDWWAQPKRPVPQTLSEWGELAIDVRESRALLDFAKNLVGGKVFHTMLTRGFFSVAEIFEFNDTGDELLQLVGYTQHPAAQVRPCWCDSGKTYLECHLAEIIDEPCGCGIAGKTFRECCMVEGGGSPSRSLSA